MLFKKNAKVLEPMSFIDLGNIPLEIDENTDTRIKVTEIREFEDITEIADLAYKGNIVVVDCLAMSKDKEEMRRLSKEFTNIAKDCNGDAVMMASRFVILSSGGIKIDRSRIQRKKT